MSVLNWLFFHGLGFLFLWWILYWNGARWLEGWKSFFLVSWFAAAWTEEQLRLYAFCLLGVQVVWCVIGLWKPEFRGG